MSTQYNKRTPDKRRRTPLWAIALTLTALLVVAAVVSVWSFLELYRPSVDTGTPFDTDDYLSGEETADPQNDPDKYIRDSESINFLVMGRDKVAWNTDVMMIVNFNYRDGSIALLQIPRDTYVEFEDMYGKINTLMKIKRAAAYSENPRASQSELLKSGVEGVTEELEKSLCIQIDGFAVVNLEGFRNVIDIIGGVSVDVPYPMHYDDPDQDLYIHIDAGAQVLDGEKSEQFVRFRSDYIQGDIGRVDAQKIFLTALFKQLQTNLTIGTIPKIAEQMIKHVTTDLSLDEIVFYAKELLSVDLTNVSMMTLPGMDARSSGGGSYYVMRRADALLVMNEYFNVYNKEITDEMFDKEHSFTADDYSVFRNIYYSESVGAVVDTADKIDGGELDIPRYY